MYAYIVQVLGQRGDMTTALTYIKQARILENKRFIPTTSHRTHELIYSIKRQQESTVSTSISKVIIHEQVREAEARERAIEKLKRGDLSL